MMTLIEKLTNYCY